MRKSQRIPRLKSATAPLVAIAAMILSASPWAEAPAKADSCTDCHGAQGQSEDSEIPIIAGPSAFYLENQLFLFQQKDRPCASEQFSAHSPAPPAEDHCDLVADFSEDDIIELAAYFADQPHKPAEQNTDPELAKAGQAIHDRSCSRCHANAGSLKLDDAGILAGQWRPYLIRTLTSFRDSDRWQDEKMAEEVEKLSDQDIKALAEFYASQSQ